MGNSILRSALVRIGLAVLVVLPPGTYRSLDLLSRRALANERVELPSSIGAESSRGEIVPLQLPLVSRDWNQVTFTSEDQMSRALAPDEMCDLAPAADDRARCQAESSLALPEPVLLGHKTARGAVLALHELLN